MNPKSSTVVWGIPQLSNDAVESIQNGDNMYVGTLMSSGSIGTIIAVLALGASAASIGLIINSKKKKSSDKSEEET